MKTGDVSLKTWDRRVCPRGAKNGALGQARLSPVFKLIITLRRAKIPGSCSLLRPQAFSGVLSGLRMSPALLQSPTGGHGIDQNHLGVAPHARRPPPEPILGSKTWRS